MTVEIWCFERSDKSHEKKELLDLAKALNTLDLPFLMICNPVLYGIEIDALVIKERMVFVVEIKSANGHITGGLKGEWKVQSPDGETWVMNEGRDRNPFEQVQREYFAVKDFFKECVPAIMTQSEIAQNDFGKIKNVLIIDPEYDPKASDIDLGRREKHLNIVGLYNNVSELFWQLEAREICISYDQAVKFARDVLCCRRALDMERLVNPRVTPRLEDQDEKTPEPVKETTKSEQVDETAPSGEDIPEKEFEQQAQAGPDSQGQPPMKVTTADTKETNFRTAETDEWPPKTVRLDYEPQADAPQQDARSVVPAEEVVDQVINQITETLGSARTIVRKGLQRIFPAPPLLEFGDFVFALREKADSSVRSLPPDNIVPNYYRVILNTAEYSHIADLKKLFQKRLRDDLYAHIHAMKYTFNTGCGRLVVVIEEESGMEKQIEIQSAFKLIAPAVILTGPDGTTRGLHPGDELSIGRGIEVNWKIPDTNEYPVASRNHCMVHVSDDGQRLSIQDTKSLNHTWVNDEQISQTEIDTDATITLGRNTLDDEGPRISVHFAKGEVVA